MKTASFGFVLLTQFTSCCWCSVPTTDFMVDLSDWYMRGKNKWSQDFLSQASDLSCEPGEVRENVTFLHGTKSGNFTKLGKVSDLEVCMLLCCELERCQAAFLAGNYCYSVTCFTTNHCAIAPALNNKWQPVVAFVKRFNKVVHVQPASQDGMGRGNNARVDKLSKKKLHLKAFFKEEGKQKQDQNGGEEITITSDGKADNVQLEELQKQTPLERNISHAQRHSAKYNLVSAAVATCLMAFILSGCAVAAAKIRKRKESAMDYTPVPDIQE